jgi:hemoglobin
MTHDTVTEDSIVALVDAFYAKVRRDPAIGPLFDRVIGDNWDAHLPRMYAFWSSVLLGSRRYRGNPMAVHQALPAFPAAFFDVWLGLFAETAAELFAPALADDIAGRARRIAESLKLGLYYRPAEADAAGTGPA